MQTKLLGIFLIFFSGMVVPIENKPNNNFTGSAQIQQMINIAKESTVLNLKPEPYVLDKPIVLHSGITINGNGAVLMPKFAKKADLGVFEAKNLSNITVKNLSIIDKGIYLNKPIHEKFDPQNPKPLIGFSNYDIGIKLVGVMRNVVISNVSFSGLNLGVFLDGSVESHQPLSDSIRIQENHFNNMGMAAIRLLNLKSSIVYGNIITGVLGNAAPLGDQLIKDTKWADGIYVQGYINSSIMNNYIRNVHRIGIVLEGVVDKKIGLIAINDNVHISGNTIERAEASINTEHNAGIWVEPYGYEDNNYKTKVCYIESNIINNLNAANGSNPQYGIRLGAVYNYVSYNIISNFNNSGSVAIRYSYGNNIFNKNIFLGNRENYFKANDNKKFSNVVFK